MSDSLLLLLWVLFSPRCSSHSFTLVFFSLSLSLSSTQRPPPPLTLYSILNGNREGHISLFFFRTLLFCINSLLRSFVHLLGRGGNTYSMRRAALIKPLRRLDSYLSEPIPMRSPRRERIALLPVTISPAASLSRRCHFGCVTTTNWREEGIPSFLDIYTCAI